MAAVPAGGRPTDPPTSRTHGRAALARLGVTRAALALWALHEVVVLGAAAVPFPGSTKTPEAFGLPWFRADAALYARIAATGWGWPAAPAFFGPPAAYLWLAHSPVVALVGIQFLFGVLLVQVGRAAAAWGLTGWRVTAVQALVALSPATILYATVYPEIGVLLALGGMLIALRAHRPLRTAAWAFVAGVLDPIGLVMGVGAGVWTVWGLATRSWATVRTGILWGVGSVVALALTMAVLVINHRGPLAFITAQRAYGGRWLWPWIQPAFALETFVRGAPLTLVTLVGLAMLPVFAWGTWRVLRRAGQDQWHASVAAITAALFLLPLSFYAVYRPISGADIFWSVDLIALVAVVEGSSRRAVAGVILWSASWAVVGALAFTHGHYWG